MDHTGPYVARVIQQLDKEFDLTMIADNFDECLLILRNIFYSVTDNFRPG